MTEPITDDEIATLAGRLEIADTVCASWAWRMVARIRSDAAEIKRLRGEGSGTDAEWLAATREAYDKLCLHTDDLRAKLRVAEEALEFIAESNRHGEHPFKIEAMCALEEIRAKCPSDPRNKINDSLR